MGRALSKTAGFWFRKKYNLPPTDPRYLDLSREAILTEYWAYRYEAEPDLDEKEVRDDTWDKDELLRQFAAEAAIDDNWEDA